MSNASLWIFGYGSLVWRPDFAHDHCEPATIQGWVRRFWQASTDHRGLPEYPGRVVTLVRADDHALPDSESPGRHDATCWGVAYRVPSLERDQVLAELDHRERGGYERVETTITLSPNAPAPRRVTGLVYVAGPQNPNYLGPISVSSIARQVVDATGPSGPNPEYVNELARSLRDMQASDDHVFAVEAALAKLDAERGE